MPVSNSFKSVALLVLVPLIGSQTYTVRCPMEQVVRAFVQGIQPSPFKGTCPIPITE